ncbi:MAG: hypothetical protein N2050_06055 [Flavobacteriales bacterium]|nr:hypothetical protein [Flavobacteriales bacterium]MCX7650101.1 hypothetical protein [Flavobacteriales bacterium]MDW8431469.1 hypothetical protein [Flavobacteriales bacterium]
MKKIFFLCITASLSMISCKKEVCIRCTPIADPSGPEQRECSKDKDERASFMVKWIKAGYNCAED